ncbi:MAG: protein translocase subunit SecD, partial [Bilophila sp.]
MKNLQYRLAIAAVILFGALCLLAPTFMPADMNVPGSRINLGLDLKGGVQLTLGVDTDKALQTTLRNTGQMLRQKARESGITVLGPRLLPNGVQELVLAKPDQLDRFLSLTNASAPQVVTGTPRSGTDGGLHIPLSFTAAFAKQTEDLAVDQVLRTISNRIDQFGVAEPDIRKQQGNRILIQLPGLTNVKRAVQLVGQAAQLSFHLVRDDLTQGLLPPGVSLFPMQERKGTGLAPLPLDTAPLLSGEEVADARPGFDDKSASLVSLSFTPRGADLFEIATGEHKGKRLAIVLDGVVHSAPVIQEKIAGGTASISGQFTPEEAQDLAISLRSGSLAAPVQVLEERTVGPALGEASILSGLLAALIGTLAVMIIMPLRYGWSGMLANAMLFCTLSLLMGCMAALGATLTLPGIAGVVLTIGMAVDANVLIFERIREELALGLTPAKAIRAGFERANLSITDSNLTTILVAAILYQFGTGPVRGFAVTLTLGIIASMFSAIFLCRIALDTWVRKDGAKLNMHGPMEMRAASRALAAFPFLRHAKHVGLLTALLLVAALGVGTSQGGLRYGVD